MQVTSNGISLETAQRGPIDGQPIILIRGLGTQMVFWPDELLDGFAALGYRVITFDNRDVGLSQRCPKPGVADDAQSIIDTVRRGEAPDTAYSLNDMADDVVGLMDALSIEKAHIFGISMGGGIAQLMALNHAERCLSVTIVMSAARFASGDLLELLVAWPRAKSDFAADILFGEAAWGSPGYAMSQEEIIAMANRAYDRGHDPAGINRQALATSQSGDRSQSLRSIELPCTIIHGTDDTLIPPEAGQELASLISNASYHQIDGMGHTITPLLAPKIVTLVDDMMAKL